VACCGCCCNPYKTVEAGNQGVITSFGRVKEVVEPGMVYVNPLSEKLVAVNVKNQVKSLSSQEVMTLDQLPVTIEGDVFYKKIDAVRATYGVQNVEYSIDQLAMNSLRNVFGRYTLQDCLANRSQIADETLELAKSFSQEIGVQISSIQIKDIRLPQHIRNMLASTATAEREGQATLITAEANVKAAEMMRRAADMLNSEGAMQIRGLEVIERLASSSNSKLVFIPTNFGVTPGSTGNNNNGGGGSAAGGPTITLNTN
jgi:regulator of protease activity HflC (stomatin/prohibitin superfamily)